MLTAQSSVNSDKAVAYLKKFCRHFAHKLPTEFNDDSGYAVSYTHLTLPTKRIV